ncbi:hypothetical protein IV203_020502 [Nitzschia inconspicua]|uniref:Uncharacterized protein n=2 Tax=Nitzschia inconspicua TaxID=303405 RepID=A0A9K3P9A5_9STRA|nr:hypothetical protein IV203_020502 [Nitzschia inconspicua]
MVAATIQYYGQDHITMNNNNHNDDSPSQEEEEEEEDGGDGGSNTSHSISKQSSSHNLTLDDIWKDFTETTNEYEDSNTTNANAAANNANNNNNNITAAMQRAAILELEDAKIQIRTLQEANQSKEREIALLRQSDQQTQESIANLLRAVETSNEVSTSAAQTALVQAKLRAEALHATEEKNHAVQQLQQTQHSLQLVKADLDHYKTKAHHLSMAKQQLERDYRAAQAVYGSLQGSINTDVEYYKRKTYIKSSQSVLTQKNREIAELRKDRDRQLSQNRLAQLKAAAAAAENENHNSNNKKSCHSY